MKINTIKILFYLCTYAVIFCIFTGVYGILVKNTFTPWFWFMLSILFASPVIVDIISFHWKTRKKN